MALRTRTKKNSASTPNASPLTGPVPGAPKKISIRSQQDAPPLVPELDAPLASALSTMMTKEFGRPLELYVIEYEKLRQKDEKSRVMALAGNTNQAIFLELKKSRAGYLVVGTAPLSPVGLVGSASTFLRTPSYARTMLGFRAIKLDGVQDTAIWLLPVTGERGTPDSFFRNLDSTSEQPVALPSAPADTAAQPLRSTLEDLGLLLKVLSGVPDRVFNAVNANIVAKLEAASNDAMAAQELGAETTTALQELCSTAQGLVVELKGEFSKIQQEHRALASERAELQQIIKDAKDLRQKWEDETFGQE